MTAKKSSNVLALDYEVADAAALVALHAGTADEIQQKRALEWILYKACGIRELSYRPESDRDSAFAEGRRFVGLQIGKLIFNFANLRKRPTQDG